MNSFKLAVSLLCNYFKSGDPLTMDYFDNFDNGSINKYKKNLKNRFFFFINVLFYL
jgi:hypothetical protein